MKVFLEWLYTRRSKYDYVFIFSQTNLIRKINLDRTVILPKHFLLPGGNLVNGTSNGWEPTVKSFVAIRFQGNHYFCSVITVMIITEEGQVDKFFCGFVKCNASVSKSNHRAVNISFYCKKLWKFNGNNGWTSYVLMHTEEAVRSVWVPNR